MTFTQEIELRGTMLRVDLAVQSVLGAPMSVRDAGDVEGAAHVATIETADGMRATVGVCSWPGDEADVRLLDFWSGADDYRRLERAGKMSLAMVADRRVGILRAMRYGEREWPTLQTVDWAQLDQLAGTDFAALLTEHGATVGTVAELNPAGRRFKEAPAFAFADAPVSALVAFAVTRVVPIMVGFGRPGLESVHG